MWRILIVLQIVVLLTLLLLLPNWNIYKIQDPTPQSQILWPFEWNDTNYINGTEERCMIVRTVFPDKANKNVFMIESSKTQRLSYRSLCSAESWALHNPSFDIWYLLTTNCTDDSDFLLSRLLSTYANFHLAQVPVDTVMDGTPLQSLYTSKRWQKKRTWPVTDLSDMLRVIYIYRYGGIYSDADIICIRPFSIPLNAVGYESKVKLNNAILSFTKYHKFLASVMDDMKKNFKPAHWGVIGPDPINTIAKQWCKAANQPFDYINKPYPCGNVTIYPNNYFYPLTWKQYKKYIDDHGANNFDKDFRRTYTLHVFDHLSKVLAVRMDGNSIYEHAAKNNCPLTYRHATRRSSFF